MSRFVIVSDSSCDLSTDLLTEHDIDLVPYYVTFDGINYKRDNIDITIDEFYKTIENKKIYPKTSLPPTSDYINVFKKPLELGEDILCICLTSKFSGSFQSANLAKNILLEKYPDRKILIVDSMLCTTAQGMLVLEAVKQRDKGKSIEETNSILDQIKLQTRIIFTVDNLDYLQRGGRIGKVSALAGSLLNIKPLIYIKDGELIPHSKIRGRKKAIDEVLQIAGKETEGKRDRYHIGLVHTDVYQDILAVSKKLSLLWDIPESDLPISRIGATIGTHIGPSVVGIVYMPKTD